MVSHAERNERRAEREEAGEACDGLAVDEGEQLGGRADERAFPLPEQAGEIERHSVTDPSRLRDEPWTRPGRGRRVTLERLEDSSLHRRDHADG